MRISLEQAKRLGIAVPKQGGTAVRKARAAPGKAKGKDRLARVRYPAAAVTFEIDLPSDPQPKERPRTVVNTASLVKAFVEARGNLSAFKAMISRDREGGRDAPQRIRTSHTYTPKNTADYEELVRVHAMAAMARAGLKPFEVPVKTHVHLVFEGEEDTWPTSPGDGDADNLEKAVLDALNKVVFADDRLVVMSVRSKSCGPKARLVVRVSAAGPMRHGGGRR
jgi:Holliday junction resolvase RusA-like endonuclease